MVYMPYNDYKGDCMAEFEVILYEKENGDCPVEEFIDSLDVKMRAKMIGLLELLEEKGNEYYISFTISTRSIIFIKITLQRNAKAFLLMRLPIRRLSTAWKSVLASFCFISS